MKAIKNSLQKLLSYFEGPISFLLASYPQIIEKMNSHKVGVVNIFAVSSQQESSVQCRGHKRRRKVGRGQE